MPPTMAHNAMKNTHMPPCRLRASCTVTVLYQRAVTGRLRRQAMMGEITSSRNVGTTGQYSPDLIPWTSEITEKMPPTLSKILEITCIFRAHSRPLRTALPYRAITKAIGQRTTNNNTFTKVGLRLSDFALADKPKYKLNRGVTNSCTVNPQS